MDIETYKQWGPVAQQKALERLRELSNEKWRPFYCLKHDCDGKAHDDWNWSHARTDQRPPLDDYFAWLLLGGRGGGKTRSGAEYTHRIVDVVPRIIIVGATGGDIRDTLVEGESGILATSAPGRRPHFEPSKRRLTWPNGAIALLLSAEEPDRLRGPQCLVAGTMVQTEFGERPIEDISVGDFVWTRRGLRRVTDTRSSMREVMALRHPDATIVGTPDHRIWTNNRGWVELQFIRPSDIMERWESRTSTPLLVGAISNQQVATRCSTPAGSGSSTTVPSLMGTRSITSTATDLMTGSRTSLVSPWISTQKHTEQWSTSTSVQDAEGRSSRRGENCASGAPTASACRFGNSSMKQRSTDGVGLRSASSVERSSRLEAEPYAHSAVSTYGPMHRVYDLTVEGEPEFYANGVLVHNSYWAWLDEAAHFPLIDDVWSNLLFGLRLGRTPRVLITTTPKPRPWLKDLLKNPTTRMARASTYQNLHNLAPTFAEQIIKQYEGTRIGRQELHAEILTDVEGALWNWEMLEGCRVAEEPEEFDRIVVAVDPAGTSNKNSDETGVVVVGYVDGTSYVISDRTSKYTPNGWASAVRTLYEDFSADAVVVETNFGGDMVKHTLRSAGVTARIIEVNAHRGKALRAEPVVALYEQGKVKHVGDLSNLETEMCEWTPFDRKSPNRIDAMVYGVTYVAKHVSRAQIGNPSHLKLVV